MRFRVATDADAEAWQALLGATASGDFLRLGVGRGRGFRRPAAAALPPRGRRANRGDRRAPQGGAWSWRPDVLVRPARAGARLVSARGGDAPGCPPGRAPHGRARASGRRGEARASSPRGTPELGRLHGRGLRRTDEALQVGHTRLVSLTDDSALIAGFDKDTRYAVRRAAREGVDVTAVEDATDLSAVDALHRARRRDSAARRVPDAAPRTPSRTWGALAGAGRAVILEARRGDELLASGMLVLEGDRSFYLFNVIARSPASRSTTPATRFNGR